jgi:hypothetical protein
MSEEWNKHMLSPTEHLCTDISKAFLSRNLIRLSNILCERMRALLPYSPVIEKSQFLNIICIFNIYINLYYHKLLSFL